MALPQGAVTEAVISVVFTLLALLALISRLLSRQIMKVQLSFNDYAAIMAMIFAAGVASVFLTAAFSAGLGVHLKDVPPKELATHLKLFIPAQILWGAANSCVKLSILDLYINIFPNRLFHRMCYFTMMLTVCYFISVLLETFLLCRPVAYSWDKAIPGGYCTNENLAYLIAGTMNLVIDIIAVALPMPMLWGLQVPLLRRFGVAGMFSLGAVICVISLQRVLWLRTWDLTDMTYTVVPGACWSTLEPTLGVVNACLPTMRPWLKKLFDKDIFAWSKTQRSDFGHRSRRLNRTHGPLDYSNETGRFQRLNDPQYTLDHLKPAMNPSAV